VGFKYLKNISLIAASLIRLDNLFHSLGADAWKDLSPYIAGLQKINLF